MKMIIVLDKLCLMGVIAASLYIGYKAGVASVEAKDTINTLHEVFADKE